VARLVAKGFRRRKKTKKKITRAKRILTLFTEKNAFRLQKCIWRTEGSERGRVRKRIIEEKPKKRLYRIEAPREEEESTKPRGGGGIKGGRGPFFVADLIWKGGHLTEFPVDKPRLGEWGRGLWPTS